jgi:soluble lytic murein transglycosylase-like protein
VAHEWHARAALWAGDWRRAAQAIEAMPESLRSQNRWRYWAARAREAAGDSGRGARGILDRHATDNWYAVLSAARLGERFAPTLQEIDLHKRAIDELAHEPGFLRTRELLLCDLPSEAATEWQIAYELLTPAQQVQAIGLADRWGWHNQSIAAAAKQTLYNDYPLLYPRPYDKEVRAAARLTDLPEELIYAVIRQESLYRADAGSSAGALGLMQLLPTTARLAARRWGLKEPARADLLRPAVNVPIGAGELKSLLERFDGQTLLATAAYKRRPWRRAPLAASDCDGRRHLGREHPVQRNPHVCATGCMAQPGIRLARQSQGTRCDLMAWSTACRNAGYRCRRNTMNKNLTRSGVVVICTCMFVATAFGSNQPPRAEIFAGLPGVLNVAISPNGQMLASDRYGPSGTSIEVYDAGTGVVRRTIDLGNVNKLRSLNWATDQVLLVEVSATHVFGESASKQRAYEWQRTLAIDVDRGSVRKMLLDDTGDTYVTASTLYATRPGRPDVVAMGTMTHSVARQRGVIDSHLSDDRRDTGWAYTLYDVSSRTGKGKPTAIGTQYTRDWAIDKQGLAVARSEWHADSEEFTILARDAAAWREIYKRKDGEQLELGGLAPDGKSVLAVGHNGGSRSKVWAIALDGSGATVFFEDPEEDIEGIESDLTDGAPIGAYVGGANARLHFFDPKIEGRQTALAGPFPAAGQTAGSFKRLQTGNRQSRQPDASRSVLSGRLRHRQSGYRR